MTKLSILTPNKKLIINLEIEEVIVPAYRGELNILPGHARLVTTLSTGVLRYRMAGHADWQMVVVSWGYCEVKQDSIVILAETAETPEELDAGRIGKSLATAMERLASGELIGDELVKYQRKEERALVRKEALNTSKSQTSH